MTVRTALRLAEEAGIQLRVEGGRLRWDAETQPSADVMEALKREKAAIIDHLKVSSGAWSPEDWRAFFDERAAIAELDGEQMRGEAEAIALDCCIVEWLRHHPVPSDAGRCAHCDLGEEITAAVVPFGGEETGHVWLHPSCWQEWMISRRKLARAELAELGILPLIISPCPTAHEG